MSWNYRVVRRTGEYPESMQKNNPELKYWEYYGIHEVYYNEDGTPRACTENEISIGSEEFGELGEMLNMIKLALDKPVLEMIDFEKMTEEKKNEN